MDLDIALVWPVSVRVLVTRGFERNDDDDDDTVDIVSPRFLAMINDYVHIS